jgi:pyridoxal phosphate enzyme (YggS family)
VVDLISGLTVDRVRANFERVREQIAGAGADPEAVEILAAVKYVPVQELTVLAQAGVKVVGENRAQELERKAQAFPDAFTWDFIGHLQSRKVKDVVKRVRYIHSVSTDSVLAQLAKHATETTQVLVEVNVAGESEKSGVPPADLPAFLERCPVPVVGLMTMPPLAADPEDNRPHFAALRQLAQIHGLRHLSMGTSQDYLVAVSEGATIVRLGTILYVPAP